MEFRDVRLASGKALCQVSWRHTNALDSVLREFEATKAALDSLGASQFGQGRFLGIVHTDALNALANLEKTYFLRLVAESERLMREHLAQHFPTHTLTRRDTFFPLIGKVTRYLDPNDPTAKMPPHLATEARNLTPYRNQAAHALGNQLTFPPLARAARILKQFLFHLP